MKLTENRYRYDTGSIIDHKENQVLTIKQAVNRLNRQDTLIKIKQRHIYAMIEVLHEEINNADGELKQALVRIARTEIEY